MAEGLNRVTLIGNLGQDPELRYTQSQQAVLTMRMATTESYFDTNTKERKEKTEWHTVVLWGKRAEALNKFLSKGSRLCVEGRLQTRSWEDKTSGAKRYATEVNAQNVILLGGRGEGGGSGSGSSGGSGAQRGGGGGGFDPGPSDEFGGGGGGGHDSGGDAPNDDDIPF